MHKYSLKFWLFFWTISGLFLFGWFLFLQFKNQGTGEIISQFVEVMPLKEQTKKQYQAIASLGDFFIINHKQERTLLVLFQNNLEIRPGGGFLGAFSVVKIKNGKVASMETFDLSNFDKNIPNNIEPPYPMKEIGYVDFWKMRDSNFSPDFKTNALKAQEFYYLGGGKQKFDAVIGITANMLTSILKITGPIQMEGYPGTYDSENAIISLEYQVEKAFEEQGIAKGDRKSVMNELSKEIEKKILSFSLTEKMKLAKILIADLDQKDIQLYFKNPKIQTKMENASWAGAIDENWKKDYLMIVDANLGSFKSDYYVKRSIDYTVDLSSETPQAHLKIFYEHTAKQKDWMTRNYTDYLRVYVPKNARLIDQKNLEDTSFTEEFGKKIFNGIVEVPIGKSVVVEITYELPKDIKENYGLKIQKQAGISNEKATIQIKNPDGSIEKFSEVLE
ncbi:MAG: DUF4012 domain-containing protein [Candidatus Moranbacteria bacterium]|nr:DUF4012 domain-containing protein [Candidatus Moranbacteria bacterium]